MSFAIIVQKKPRTITRSSSVFLTKDMEEKATFLDSYLSKRIPKIEQELMAQGVLEKQISKDQSKQGRGSVLLWHALGKKFHELCKNRNIIGKTHRRWLWEAIENIYATQRIIRVARGRGRIHFEYCYQVAKYPIEFVNQVNWSEWSYFLDSRSVREEPRIEQWLFSLVKRKESITRKNFRIFVQHLNKRTKKLETSLLSDNELFEMYDQIWQKTKNNSY